MYAPKASPTFTEIATLPSSGNINISADSMDTWVLNKGYAPKASPTFTGTVTLPSSTTLTNPTLSGNITLSNTQASPGTNCLGYIQVTTNGLAKYDIPTTWYNIFTMSLTNAGIYLVWFDFSFNYTAPFLQYAISTSNSGPDNNTHYHTYGLLYSGQDFKSMMRYMYLTANQSIYVLIRCTVGSAFITLSGDNTTNIGGSGFYAVRIA